MNEKQARLPFDDTWLSTLERLILTFERRDFI